MGLLDLKGRLLLLLLLLSGFSLSNSVRHHRWQPTRLQHPWDSLGKNTGAGCHFLLQCMKVKSEGEVSQSCPTLSDPMDCSLPDSSVHGIFQARVLEWGAIAFSEAITNTNQMVHRPGVDFIHVVTHFIIINRNFILPEIPNVIIWHNEISILNY